MMSLKKTDKTPPLTKQLNLMLSNGLMLLHAKTKKSNTLCVIYATDFTSNFRLLFDLETKKLLDKSMEVKFSKADIEAIAKATELV